MTQTTVLIIDDSATIRRLVDRCLTGAGYRVVAAPTAEEGVELASNENPDLILLDHQLPGTTGTEVAKQLLEIPSACQVPVVVSSTLRKKAYAEYMELSNVVDMLPKPYTEELLTTTVENALSTAAMVVDSQAHGTAVPEVLQQGGEPDLSGRFGAFGVRELLDFLNNSGKSGILEVEGTGERVFFYLSNGRVLGISASGIAAEELTKNLPPALENLAPVVNLTIGGRGGSELEGLIELLNRKVVDPRLLRKLLRHQASMLAWRCFSGEVREFRFTTSAQQLPLIDKLPLDVSVLALLIDGALACNESELPAAEEQHVYVRRAIRGQNLDRSGVSAQHMKLLNMLGDRHTSAELAEKLGCSSDETRRVLLGMYRAELVDRTEKSLSRSVVVFESDAREASKLREALSANSQQYYGKVVRDRFALQLVLRRAKPDVFAISLGNSDALEVIKEFQLSENEGARWIGLVPSGGDEAMIRQTLDSQELAVDLLVERPNDATELIAALDRVFLETPEVRAEPAEADAAPQPSWAGSA